MSQKYLRVHSLACSLAARAADLPAAYKACCREAAAAVGNAAVFVEKCIENAKHIEVQVHADLTRALPHTRLLFWGVGLQCICVFVLLGGWVWSGLWLPSVFLFLFVAFVFRLWWTRMATIT